MFILYKWILLLEVKFNFLNEKILYWIIDRFCKNATIPEMFEMLERYED